MKNDLDVDLHQALELVDADPSGQFLREIETSLKEAIIRAKDEKYGEVESFVEFSAAEKKLLEQTINKILHKQINFIYTMNLQVLGGFKVKIGDWKLDGTLARQLEIMKSHLGGPK